jgi:hypothetical protein
VVVARESAHLLANNVAHIGYCAANSLFVINAVSTVELTGAIQSGDDIRVNAGVNRGWPIGDIMQSLRLTAVVDDFRCRHRPLSARASWTRKGDVSRRRRRRMCVWRPMSWLSPNISERVQRPRLSRSRTPTRCSRGRCRCPTASRPSSKLTEVTTTVTEQNGVQQIKIGTRVPLAGRHA